MEPPNRFPILAETDAVRFACTRCGECCFDQVVALEPQDLFRLSRSGLSANTTTALFANAVVAIERLDDAFACLLAMPKLTARTSKCRFLAPNMDDRDQVHGFHCTLHPLDAKPLACRMSPIARPLDGETYRLVPPIAACPGMEKGASRTVRSLLDAAGCEARTEARSLWFHRHLRPLLVDEASVRRVYDFDRDGRLSDLNALDAWLSASHRAGDSAENRR